MSENTIAIAEANAKEVAELDYAKLIKTPFKEVQKDGYTHYFREGTQAELAALDEDERLDYEDQLAELQRDQRIKEFEFKLSDLLEQYEADLADYSMNAGEDVVASTCGPQYFYDLTLRHE